MSRTLLGVRTASSPRLAAAKSRFCARRLYVLCLIAFAFTPNSRAGSTNLILPAYPETISNTIPRATLPGKGLAQHPFLYCGEWDTRKTVQTLFLVRDGKVV